MTNNYYQKHFEKKQVRDIKMFLKKKKIKGKKRLKADIKIFLKKKGRKAQHHCEYNKNLSEERK